jgi:hypothetical protein
MAGDTDPILASMQAMGSIGLAPYAAERIVSVSMIRRAVEHGSVTSVGLVMV